MTNGPPTPPPADAIEMDDEARTTVSSMLQTADSTTDVPETSAASTVGGSPQQQPTQEPPTESTQASAIYHKYMPKLLDHSANQRFTDLIDDAMRADLALDGDHAPSRLQITIPLVLGYMIVDDLPLARSALRRMNHFARDIPIIQTLGSLLVAVSGRDYAQIYNRAEALVDYVTLPNFPSPELGRIIHNIVPNFVNHFRNQTLLLLTRAYTSLPMRLAVIYVGLPPDKVENYLTVNGWGYDSATETFVPPKLKLRSHTANSLVPSNLNDFQSLARSVTRLEM
ncbi:hypothetical protein PM082_013634 [Marasmius tenuissimus]|nr:hypothetical protein PM082_013634 [Marasmius tenuissimus]